MRYIEDNRRAYRIAYALTQRRQFDRAAKIVAAYDDTLDCRQQRAFRLFVRVTKRPWAWKLQTALRSARGIEAYRRDVGDDPIAAEYHYFGGRVTHYSRNRGMIFTYHDKVDGPIPGTEGLRRVRFREPYS